MGGSSPLLTSCTEGALPPLRSAANLVAMPIARLRSSGPARLPSHAYTVRPASRTSRPLGSSCAALGEDAASCLKSPPSCAWYNAAGCSSPTSEPPSAAAGMLRLAGSLQPSALKKAAAAGLLVSPSSSVSTSVLPPCISSRCCRASLRAHSFVFDLARPPFHWMRRSPRSSTKQSLLLSDEAEVLSSVIRTARLPLTRRSCGSASDAGGTLAKPLLTPPALYFTPPAAENSCRNSSDSCRSTSRKMVGLPPSAPSSSTARMAAAPTSSWEEADPSQKWMSCLRAPEDVRCVWSRM
mmetsp:Transcript_37496/g.94751  ORF Transcript_37496/g.94751 Transcript_37496/m.94751 type:complete len:296 (+) Transcript_37496:1738-2625(+)